MAFNFLKFSQIKVPIPQLVEELKAATKRAVIDEIYQRYGLQYNESLHSFLVSGKRTTEDIIKMMKSMETKAVLDVMRRSRDDDVLDFSKKLNDWFETCQGKFGISREEFAHFIQISNLASPLFPLVGGGTFRDRMGIQEDARGAQGPEAEIMKPILAIMQGFRDRGADTPWGMVITGKFLGQNDYKFNERDITPNSQREIENIFREKPEIAEGSLLYPYTAQLLSEKAGFSNQQYPIKAYDIWPARNYSIISGNPEERLELLANVRSIFSNSFEDSKNIGYILRTKYKDLYRDDAKKIKRLFAVVCNLNGDQMKELLRDALAASRGFGGTLSDGVVEEIAAQVDVATAPTTTSEGLKDDLFPEYNFAFDSKREGDVVKIFRDEFCLQAVPSNLQIPIPQDFKLNKRSFKVDFILYCDVLNGFTEQNIPIIKKQTILIGEYYGYDDVNEYSVLSEDLKDVNGDVFEVDGKKFTAGTSVTIGDIYKYKTRYKKVTEDFYTKSTGCAAVSINASNSTGEIRKQIVNSLDINNVIYSPIESVRGYMPQSSAYNVLKRWMNNPKVNRESKDNPSLKKYFNFQKGTAVDKVGSYFKENKFEALIIAAIAKVKSMGYTDAINSNLSEYNASKIWEFYKEKERIEKEIDTIQFKMRGLVNHTAPLYLAMVDKVQSLMAQQAHIYDNFPYFNDIKKKFPRHLEAYQWRVSALENLLMQYRSGMADPQKIIDTITICTDRSSRESKLSKNTNPKGDMMEKEKKLT